MSKLSKTTAAVIIGLMLWLVACRYNKQDIKNVYETGYMQAIIEMNNSKLNKKEFLMQFEKYMEKSTKKYMEKISN